MYTQMLVPEFCTRAEMGNFILQFLDFARGAGLLALQPFFLVPEGAEATLQICDGLLGQSECETPLVLEGVVGPGLNPLLNIRPLVVPSQLGYRVRLERSLVTEVDRLFNRSSRWSRRSVRASSAPRSAPGCFLGA